MCVYPKELRFFQLRLRLQYFSFILSFILYYNFCDLSYEVWSPKYIELSIDFCFTDLVKEYTFKLCYLWDVQQLNPIDWK
jgi:hypothetical protein